MDRPGPSQKPDQNATWRERLLAAFHRFPFTQRLSFKFSMIIIWLGVGTIFLMTLFFLQHEEEIFRRELEKRGVNIARTLALQSVDFILTNDRYTLFDRLKLVTILLGQDQEENLVEYAQILSPQGEVLAFRLLSTRNDPYEDPLPGVVFRIREPLVRTRGDNLLDIVVPILHKGEPIGMVRLGITQKYLRRTMGRIQFQILLSILAIVAGGIFLGLWLTHKMVRPLKSLTEGALRVGQGEFGHRVPVTSRDEIGELTDTFNQMSARLADSLEKIKEAQQRLLQNEKLSALGQLSAGLAHELKNPLTSMKMILEAIQEEPQGDQATRQDLEILLKEAKQMDVILTRFLEFARPGALHRQEVNLDSLLEEVLGLMRLELEEKGIEVTLQVPQGELPVLLLDRSKIKQALMNLILNALQAMPQGGKLKIWLELNGKEEVCLNIEDTGSGILPQAADRIFDPFYTTKEKGVGLGLSVVYAIIKEHGGKITVRSVPGQSTRVTMILPHGEMA